MRRPPQEPTSYIDELHHRTSGDCWTLLDILIDAPEPRVAVRGAERSVESARRVASAMPERLAYCDRSDLERCCVSERRTLATLR